MTIPVLIAISLMWVPVGFLFLGIGEAKATGAVTGFVGALVVVGAFLQAAVFKDPFTAGLLFPHGLLYCTVAYALLAGLSDMRSVGNVSLTAGVVTLIYAVMFYTGAVGADGKVLIAKSGYLAFACAGYFVLTLEVWANAYGKFPAKGLGLSLIAWAAVGLWVPAFSLLTTGALPF